MSDSKETSIVTNLKLIQYVLDKKKIPLNAKSFGLLDPQFVAKQFGVTLPDENYGAGESSRVEWSPSNKRKKFTRKMKKSKIAKKNSHVLEKSDSNEMLEYGGWLETYPEFAKDIAFPCLSQYSANKSYDSEKELTEILNNAACNSKGSSRSKEVESDVSIAIEEDFIPLDMNLNFSHVTRLSSNQKRLLPNEVNRYQPKKFTFCEKTNVLVLSTDLKVNRNESSHIEKEMTVKNEFFDKESVSHTSNSEELQHLYQQIESVFKINSDSLMSLATHENEKVGIQLDNKPACGKSLRGKSMRRGHQHHQGDRIITSK